MSQPRGPPWVTVGVHRTQVWGCFSAPPHTEEAWDGRHLTQVFPTEATWKGSSEAVEQVGDTGRWGEGRGRGQGEEVAHRLHGRAHSSVQESRTPPKWTQCSIPSSSARSVLSAGRENSPREQDASRARWEVQGPQAAGRGEQLGALEPLPPPRCQGRPPRASLTALRNPTSLNPSPSGETERERAPQGTLPPSPGSQKWWRNAGSSQAGPRQGEAHSNPQRSTKRPSRGQGAGTGSRGRGRGMGQGTGSGVRGRGRGGRAGQGGGVPGFGLRKPSLIP